jgi:hypothetical protein
MEVAATAKLKKTWRDASSLGGIVFSRQIFTWVLPIYLSTRYNNSYVFGQLRTGSFLNTSNSIMASRCTNL